MNEAYETLKALSMSPEDKVEIDPDVLRWAISRINRLSNEVTKMEQKKSQKYWDELGPGMGMGMGT